MTRKERPILMSGPLVVATLEGHKTVTRRPVKWTEPPFETDGAVSGMTLRGKVCGGAVGIMKDLSACPFGGPGTKLWVRETWAPVDLDYWTGHVAAVPEYKAHQWPMPWPYEDGCKRVGIAYRADGEADDQLLYGGTWRPSIYMPRWACRLLLEVVSVRVERLQEITVDDCIAEGIDGEVRLGQPDAMTGTVGEVIRARFRQTWDSIYKAPYRWESNCWVWRVEYRRIEP